MTAKKQEIQQQFRNEMGLLVDQVKPGGSGTTNDGNTARRFFQNYEDSARITGINVNLLKRCAVILQTLSSGFAINSAACRQYSIETAQLYLQEYSWYYMPVTMHKILIHGADIIRTSILPIGQLSEEAQESRNKDLKYFRRSHTRKTSREHTIEDLLNFLLVSSDPLITSLRPQPRTVRNKFYEDVFQLIIPPTEVEQPESSEEVTSESDESFGNTQSDFESDY